MNIYKRIISLIVVFSFVLTQCGIGWALRENNAGGDTNPVKASLARALGAGEGNLAGRITPVQRKEIISILSLVESLWGRVSDRTLRGQHAIDGVISDITIALRRVGTAGEGEQGASGPASKGAIEGLASELRDLAESLKSIGDNVPTSLKGGGRPDSDFVQRPNGGGFIGLAQRAEDMADELSPSTSARAAGANGARVGTAASIGILDDWAKYQERMDGSLVGLGYSISVHAGPGPGNTAIVEIQAPAIIGSEGFIASGEINLDDQNIADIFVRMINATSYLDEHGGSLSTLIRALREFGLMLPQRYVTEPAKQRGIDEVISDINLDLSRDSRFAMELIRNKGGMATAEDFLNALEGHIRKSSELSFSGPGECSEYIYGLNDHTNEGRMELLAIRFFYNDNGYPDSAASARVRSERALNLIREFYVLNGDLEAGAIGTAGAAAVGAVSEANVAGGTTIPFEPYIKLVAADIIWNMPYIEFKGSEDDFAEWVKKQVEGKYIDSVNRSIKTEDLTFYPEAAKVLPGLVRNSMAALVKDDDFMQSIISIAKISCKYPRNTKDNTNIGINMTISQLMRGRNAEQDPVDWAKKGGLSDEESQKLVEAIKKCNEAMSKVLLGKVIAATGTNGAAGAAAVGQIMELSGRALKAINDANTSQEVVDAVSNFAYSLQLIFDQNEGLFRALKASGRDKDYDEVLKSMRGAADTISHEESLETARTEAVKTISEGYSSIKRIVTDAEDYANKAAAQRDVSEAVAKVRVVITDSSAFNIAVANLTPAVNEKVISIDLSGQLSGDGSLTDIGIIKNAIDDAVKAYHPAEVCTYFTNKSTLDLMLNAQGLGVEINSISDRGYEGALAYLTAA